MAYYSLKVILYALRDIKRKLNGKFDYNNIFNKIIINNNNNFKNNIEFNQKNNNFKDDGI